MCAKGGPKKYQNVRLFFFWTNTVYIILDLSSGPTNAECGIISKKNKRQSNNIFLE